MSSDPLYMVTLDVLGFKNLIEERPLADIVKMYRELIKIGTPIKFRLNKESPKAKDSFKEDTVLKHTVFSDSMIIWTEPTKSNINYFNYSFPFITGNYTQLCKSTILKIGHP